MCARARVSLEAQEHAVRGDEEGSAEVVHHILPDPRGVRAPQRGDRGGPQPLARGLVKEWISLRRPWRHAHISAIPKFNSGLSNKSFLTYVHSNTAGIVL